MAKDTAHYDPDSEGEEEEEVLETMDDYAIPEDTAVVPAPSSTNALSTEASSAAAGAGAAASAGAMEESGEFSASNDFEDDSADVFDDFEDEGVSCREEAY